MFDCSGPESRQSGGSGGSGVLDPSLPSEEDIKRSGMSLKNDPKTIQTQLPIWQFVYV